MWRRSVPARFVEPRGAFAFAAAIAGAVAVVVAPFDVIGKARHSRARPHILELPRRRTAFQRCARKGARLTHPTAMPVGVENLVKSLPIGMRCAKQRPQRRLERRWPRRQRRGKNRQRIAGLRQTDLETIVAQRACKTGQPPTRRRTDALA